jgi:hypothetical protein
MTILAVLALSALSTQVYALPDNPVAGAFQLGYADDATGGRRTNDWAALGSVVFTLDDPGLNIQLAGAYDRLNLPAFSNRRVETLKGAPVLIQTSTGADAAQWQYGGDVFWRSLAGIVGINATGTHVSSHSETSTVFTPPGGTPAITSSAFHDTSENAGLFGEYFPFGDITAREKAGWLGGRMHGYYAGTAMVYYPAAQISLSAGANYALMQDAREKDIAVIAEYLPVRSIPVALQLTYTFARYRGTMVGGFEDDNIFGAALKVYLGGRGDSLRDYQRNGTTDWDRPQAALSRFDL